MVEHKEYFFSNKENFKKKFYILILSFPKEVKAGKSEHTEKYSIVSF